MPFWSSSLSASISPLFQHLTITNAARNGAYYAAQSTENAANLAGITDAA
jgi:hypothetical protein